MTQSTPIPAHRRPTRPREKTSDGVPINPYRIAAGDETASYAYAGEDRHQLHRTTSEALNRQLAEVTGTAGSWKQQSATKYAKTGLPEKRRPGRPRKEAV